MFNNSIVNRILLLIVVIFSFFLNSCKKSSNNTSNSSSGSASIVAHIYNSDGSYFWNNTFKIEALGDQCVEDNIASVWNYYALPIDAVGVSDWYFITLKNKIAIKNYSLCSTNYPTNDDQFKLTLYYWTGSSTYKNYYAKSGTLTITNITPDSDIFGSGIRISGVWRGVAAIDTDNYYDEKQAELIINNMLYRN
jgi:hypothetical protein